MGRRSVVGVKLISDLVGVELVAVDIVGVDIVGIIPVFRLKLIVGWSRVERFFRSLHR